LPLLAKAQEPQLKAPAQAELAGPATPEDQVDIADAWWNAAASQGDAARRSIYQHAGQWYERARPEISDPDLLARVDERLRQVAALDRVQPPEAPVADEPAETVDVESLGLFDGRTGQVRRLLVQARGGSDQTEQAVAAALDWLAKHQMPDGGWSFDHAMAVQGVGTDGGNMPQARNAATGLTLLAFLGAGHTHKSGSYQTKVEQGLRYLGSRVKLQKNQSGSFREEGGTMYSHGIATQALCEAYALTKDKSLHVPCQMALAFIIRGQHAGGGWRYEPNEKGDTSVTGWQLTALELGGAAGIQPPATTLTQVGKFLDAVQFDGGAKYGYQRPGGSDCTTAIGLLSRIYLGWPRDQVALERGVDDLSRANPKGRPMYFNYFATQVLQNYGGEPWEKWNRAICARLLPRQGTEAAATGSWFLSDKHSRPGGRLCCTALATLILESYYRYLPAYPETRREIAEAIRSAQVPAEAGTPADEQQSRDH
jgi:hypothetical protein